MATEATLQTTPPVTPHGAPEVPADAATRTPAEHQLTLDHMAEAASVVICQRWPSSDPVLVRAHAAQDRYAHPTADRSAVAIATYVPADSEEGSVLPTVDVALGGSLTMDAAHVAAAVALGVVLSVHPGRNADAVKRQRRALHGLTGAVKAPASLRLADILGIGDIDRKLADTSALAQAIRAARKAQGSDPDPIGGASLPGVRAGKRWTLPNALTGKASELRFAGIIPSEWSGQEATLSLMVGGKSVTLATGTLTYSKR